MIQISIRACLIVAFIAGLTFFGQLPWWVIVAVGLYNVPGTWKFWLPGKKKEFEAQIAKLIEAQKEAEFNKILPTKGYIN